jgi:general secretion pathway protein B
MQVAGSLNLPDLNIDIHVYSAVPADRFVFINMNQYRENATLAEGPLLREITEEGVILEYGGAAFLLPKD